MVVFEEVVVQEKPNVQPQRGIGDMSDIARYRQFAESPPEWHHAMTKKLLRKVDVHLLPLLILM
jgi:hypothetical protein